MTTDTTTSTDALVQATSGAIAVLPLEQIHPHPKNIRHNAVADDEMVESIRSQGLIQPLVVAPMPGTEPTYRLIAGHRRLDGLRRAEATHATVIIRRDLVDEADQVAAMLVENCRRTDLTPMEEAEGYGQLRFDFGWKPGQIAKAAGHNVDTINKRLRLLKLDKKVQKTVDDGQLSLDDALAVAALPTTVQKQVSKHAGTSNFKWEVSKAKEKIAAQAKADKLIAELEAQGIPKLKLPPGKTWTTHLTHAEHGMTALGQTFSRDRDQHAGCLAFVLTKDQRGADVVEYVCTNVPGHDEQLDEERRAKRAAEEERERQRAEHEAAVKIARGLRGDAVLESVKPGAKVDPKLLALVGVSLPSLIVNLGTLELGDYFELVGVPDDKRWRGGLYQFRQEDADRFNAYAEALAGGTPRVILRALTAYLVVRAEHGQVAGAMHHVGLGDRKVTNTDRARLPEALRWLQHTEDVGHHLTDTEVELRDEVLTDLAGAEDGAQP